MAVIRNARKRPRSTWGFPKDEEIQFTLDEFRRAKRTGVPLAKMDLTVKCLGGKTHTIRVEFPGSMKLMHHTDMEGERTMMKLGGAKPECILFMDIFRESPLAACGGRYYAMKLLKAMEKVRSMKGHEREKFTDMFQKSFQERLTVNLSFIHNQVLDRINSRFASVLPQARWYSPPRTLVSEEEIAERPLKIRFKLVFEDKLNKQGGNESEA